MTTRYRLARPDDSAELLAIYTPYITGTTISFEIAVPTQDEYADRVARTASFYPYLIAENDAGICGYAYASPFHEREGYKYSVSVSVYLRPECKGKGMGKALYRRLFAILPLQGVRLAYALITQPNTPSVKLHAACGFSETGLFRNSGYKHGKWLDVLYMEKKIREFDDEPGPLQSIAELPSATIAAILGGDAL